MRATIFFAAIAVSSAWVQSATSQGMGIFATVVDRAGNRHEVRRLTYQGSDDLEIYVGNQRRIVKMQDVDRLTMKGDKNDEEQTVVLTMRSGERLKAAIFSGGSGSTPHRDTFGGGTVMQRFGGVTNLGPFLILLPEVRDIVFRHQDEARAKVALNATVVNESGERFEVTNLRYRGKRKFDYAQGLKVRSKDMARIRRLDFSETTSGTESRTVTVTFRSGRTTQGTVDASTVRLSGETDRIYKRRVGSAFTGKSAVSPFAIGLHEIKLIRFHIADEEGEGADASGSPITQ